MVFIFNDCEVEESLFSVATTTLIIDRPSVLCISDAEDDDKALWIDESIKSFASSRRRVI